jgi:hypothetical protein
MDIKPTPYHTIYSPIFQWFVDMQNDDEIIITGAAYDVPADNYEEFDLEIDQTKLGETLVQTNTLKGTIRKFQFYSDDYLLLDFVKKKKSETKRFRVNLAWLSAEPIHRKVIIWKWLFASLAALASMALCLFFTINEALKTEYGFVAGTASLTVALILLLIFIYHMRNEYTFNSQFGGARLFIIENKRPEQNAFDHFFVKLQQAIDNSKANIPVSDRLVGELKMCRRLSDEGIIDDEAYTVARTRIFKHEQYKT